MKEFTATEIPSFRWNIIPFQTHSITDLPNLFNITIQEDKMADNLNIRIGEKYPITVKISPNSTDYNEFTINPESYVKVFDASGGYVQTIGNLVIDNTLKTITYIWDTTPSLNTSIVNTPQQYTIIIWADITYVTAEGEVINTLIASDNITKNLIRSSRLI